jgi:hypothetical protein
VCDITGKKLEVPGYVITGHHGKDRRLDRWATKQARAPRGLLTKTIARLTGRLGGVGGWGAAPGTKSTVPPAPCSASGVAFSPHRPPGPDADAPTESPKFCSDASGFRPTRFRHRYFIASEERRLWLGQSQRQGSLKLSRSAPWSACRPLRLRTASGLLIVTGWQL